MLRCQDVEAVERVEVEEQAEVASEGRGRITRTCSLFPVTPGAPKAPELGQ